MPRLSDICTRCRQSYGDHYGESCVKGGHGTFSSSEVEPAHEDVCAHCKKEYGEHYGPSHGPPAFCYGEDEHKVACGDIEGHQVSKRRQFAYYEVPWMRDMNQTPTAVGDRVQFMLHPNWTEGVVEKVMGENEGYNKPYFRIRREKDNQLYDRFREHTESMCEDF